jgi:acyl carrier protein
MKNKILAVITDAASIPVTEDMSLEALDLDSLEFYELVQRIETDFGVEFSNDAILKLHTVQDILDYLYAAHASPVSSV